MNTAHILYKTEDEDRPSIICDSNGEVILQLCRVCNGTEGALPTECPGKLISFTDLEAIYRGELDYKEGNWLYIIKGIEKEKS